MENLKLLFLIYVRPAFAFSEIMDRGSWLVAAGLALVVAIPFFATVNAKLDAAYRVPALHEYIDESIYYSDLEPDVIERRQAEATREYQTAMTNRAKVPLAGDRFFRFFSFEPTGFYRPMLGISLFYVPLLILLVSVFTGIGSFGLLLRRDYAVLATCALMAWAAAHLPFSVAGIAMFGSEIDPAIHFAMWAASGAVFGALMVFAIRTVFGTSYAAAVAAVALGWPAFTFAMYFFQFVSPWLFWGFLPICLLIYFGGYVGGQVSGLGGAFRQRQNLKRFLQNATINPRDADAHVQLGLIYLDRRQELRAAEHFDKALAIDRTEIDANYEIGRLARAKGDLQNALDHFAVVLEQDERFRLSEIWREIGATYLAAGMLEEAEDALKKFVDRRNVDPEGLYYYGKVLKARGEHDRAREMFESAIESAHTSPYFRTRQLGQWSKLATKEL
jgi:hypothetical protein